MKSRTASKITKWYFHQCCWVLHLVFALQMLSVAALATASGPTCPHLFELTQLSNHAHRAIEEDLHRGVVVDIRPHSENNNNHQLFLAVLYNPGTHRTRTAYVKIRFYGDDGGWSNPAKEYAAYALSRYLHLELIPPMAYRHIELSGEDSRLVHQNGSLISEQAVVIFAVPDARTFQSFRARDFNSGTEFQNWEYPLAFTTGQVIHPKEFLGDVRVMAVLMSNPDLHDKNLLVGKHWVNGRRSPFIIDFAGSGMGGGGFLTMTHYPVWGNSEPIYSIREETLLRLKNLRREDLDLIWPGEQFMTIAEKNQVYQTAQGIVSYLLREKLAASIMEESRR